MPEPAPFYAAVADAPEGVSAVWLRAADGRRIRLSLTPPGPRGLALILPGRTEYAEKYGPVMGQLMALGLGSAVIDWRGQGLSERPGGDTGLGHVGDFSEYRMDLAAMCAHLADRPEPRVMICHSMGGAIGLAALTGGLAVRGAVFCAPMWGLAMAPWLRAITPLVARAAVRLGLALRHAPGGDARFYVLSAPFEGNLLTSDRTQWEWMRGQLRRHPELGLGGPSFGWVDAAFREMARLAAAPAPALPALGLLGSAEALVSPEAVRAGLARMPAGRLVELSGARHEPFFETPAIRAQVWRAIAAHLERIGL